MLSHLGRIDIDSLSPSIGSSREAHIRSLNRCFRDSLHKKKIVFTGKHTKFENRNSRKVFLWNAKLRGFWDCQLSYTCIQYWQPIDQSMLYPHLFRPFEDLCERVTHYTPWFNFDGKRTLSYVGYRESWEFSSAPANAYLQRSYWRH